MKRYFSVEVLASGTWLALALYKDELSAYHKYGQEIMEQLWDNVRVRMLEVATDEVIMKHNDEEDLPW